MIKERDVYCPDNYHWNDALQYCAPDAPPTPSPVGPCASGSRWDPVCNQCVPEGMLNGVVCAEKPGTPLPKHGNCPSGYLYDSYNNQCVPDHTPTVDCPYGTHWDQQFYNCVPIAGFPQTPTFNPLQSLFGGVGSFSRANPVIVAALVAGGLWLASGKHLKPVRRLI